MKPARLHRLCATQRVWSLQQGHPAAEPGRSLGTAKVPTMQSLGVLCVSGAVGAGSGSINWRAAKGSCWDQPRKSCLLLSFSQQRVRGFSGFKGFPDGVCWKGCWVNFDSIMFMPFSYCGMRGCWGLPELCVSGLVRGTNTESILLSLGTGAKHSGSWPSHFLNHQFFSFVVQNNL